MKRDDLIFDIIEKEHQRQLKGIELIASENFVSDQVMEAMGSCLTNKYAEGYPGKRYYGGCEVVDQSEQIAIDRIKEIFGAEWANVQPHSGAQANAAVFLAVLNPGDKFMGLNLAHGGHLSHGSLVNTSGIIYTPCEYNLNKETGRVDYDQMEEVALREKPKDDHRWRFSIFPRMGLQAYARNRRQSRCYPDDRYGSPCRTDCSRIAG